MQHSRLCGETRQRSGLAGAASSRWAPLPIYACPTPTALFGEPTCLPRDWIAGSPRRLAGAGIAIADRRTDRTIEEVEGAISGAAELTRTINTWEGRWPLNTYRDRDHSKLSHSALDRLATAETMTLADYGAAIARRTRIREIHAGLAARYDAAITLSAPGAAPLGLGSTGNPVFVVPGSLLGVPSLSLPILSSEGLPLGLQLIGFSGGDARLFAIATAVRDVLRAEG